MPVTVQTIPATCPADKITLARQWLDESDAVLIGAGAGLSASGGFDYGDEARARELFPDHHACGLSTVMEILWAFWTVNPENAEAFWAVWSRHIDENLYKAPLLEPYRLLEVLVRGREYFVVSSNVDGQFVKAGIDCEKLFEPQGSYALFQCSGPCCDKVYDNRSIIEAMIERIPNRVAIRAEDIPLCPECGSLLMPNLHCDARFVAGPHMEAYPRYARFIETHQNRRLVLLEIGCGFNSPGVIRHPFEAIARTCPDVRLIRINTNDAGVPVGLTGKAVGVCCDAQAALERLLMK